MNIFDPASPQPGRYNNVPIDVYHSSTGSVSSTGLSRCLTKSPAHYLYERENRVPKDYFDIGSATHTAILEPHDLANVVAMVEVEKSNGELADDYRTKAAQDERDRLRAAFPHKYVLLPNQYEKVLSMRDGLMAAATAYGFDPNPFELIRAGEPEQTFVAPDEKSGLMKRARPDVLIPSVKMIVDLKTSHDAAPRGFAKKRRDLGYDLSAAFHLDTVCQVLDEDPSEWTYLWVVIESSAPYVIGVFEASPELLQLGRAKVRQGLDLVAQCQATGIYPPYSNRIEPLGIDSWERERI